MKNTALPRGCCVDQSGQYWLQDINGYGLPLRR